MWPWPFKRRSRLEPSGDLPPLPEEVHVHLPRPRLFEMSRRSTEKLMLRALDSGLGVHLPDRSYRLRMVVVDFVRAEFAFSPEEALYRIPEEAKIWLQTAAAAPYSVECEFRRLASCALPEEVQVRLPRPLSYQKSCAAMEDVMLRALDHELRAYRRDRGYRLRMWGEFARAECVFSLEEAVYQIPEEAKIWLRTAAAAPYSVECEFRRLAYRANRRSDEGFVQSRRDGK